MLKSVLMLSSVMALRFFGLFLVLPVISIFALNLKGSTTALVGMVISGYALTQMLLQIPFGILSDKIGRKKAIIIGLIIFALGSLVCAHSNDIFTLLIGRLLQGAGAIGAVITATITDLVKEEKRSKAMAIMGSFIALSFVLSMVLGPIIGGYYGITYLFYITLFLTIISIYLIIFKIPNPPQIIHTKNKKIKIKKLLLDKNLFKMNITNLLQKSIMSFTFMIVPIILTKTFLWQTKDLWKIYLPSILCGIVAMGISSIFSEKKSKAKEFLLFGVLIFLVSYICFIFSNNLIFFIAGIILFFIGFNIHEPIMQSLTSKFAKSNQRGLVLGIFNAHGYFGTFLGGVLGGILFHFLELKSISFFFIFICLLWLIFLFNLDTPLNKKILYLDAGNYDSNTIKKLEDNNIEDCYINYNENKLIVKYDNRLVDEEFIKNLLK